ncbi:MAG TPA: hypothetical protein PLB52_02120 [Candidatus Moranbacteria bacterium]|nr:hypothetical protein [Candidatus Moranbacteria bacterium]
MNKGEEILLVIGFGFQWDHSYGCANERLAKQTLEELEKGEKPVFAQWRIFRKMRFSDCLKCIDLDIKKHIHVYGQSEKHLSSLKTIKAFKEWQKENYPELKRIILITAPPLWKRCKRELNKVFPGINISIVNFPDMDEPKDWFGKKSIFWWTRSEWQWNLREKIISLFPWKIYEIIFS